MGKSYREIGKMAEDAVGKIKDKDLRREAFRIVLLQLMAGANVGNGGSEKAARPKAKAGRPAKKKPARPLWPKPAHRPGRRGGGVATLAIQKLIDGGSFRTGRNAAGIMAELAKKHIILQPSQLRMVLLRFSRARKLKRRVKMKGDKVTYLYSVK